MLALYEVKQLFVDISSEVESIIKTLKLEDLKQSLDNLETKTIEPDFWKNSDIATSTIKKIKSLKHQVSLGMSLLEKKEELDIAYEIALSDETEIPLFESTLSSCQSILETVQLNTFFDDSIDPLDIILEIHPGAGGTESQDWAMMLYRMYQRFCEQNNYQFSVMDYQPGDEAGLKSATISIKGDRAFGYLKSENGVHRLVRLSPFDSSGRRHTSFASISIIPEFDNNIDLEINDGDLKIDTFRSSGAGGQSVNTTDSAVRITHLPSGTVVSCQNERSQIKNRETAMRILKSKLYTIELEKQHETISSFRQTKDNSFGSQIRSYVMHPYSMVKDHRTNSETSQVQKVLDGDLYPFINAFLHWNGEQNG
jgi:peptide chain release factor 2